MTLATTASKALYQGAGLVGPFAYPFRVFAATDLNVIRRSVAGIESTLVYGVDYTVTGVGDASGNVNLTVALAVGETLAIRRVRPVLQDISVRNQGAFLPQTHEDAFDRLAMIDQQQQEQLDRSFKLAPTLDPTGLDFLIRDLTAGKVLTGTGTGLTMSTLDSSAVALPGEGRTVQTLSAYLINNKVYNTMDYAPVGVIINTGVNDATGADDAAIAAAAAAGGGIVYTPPGRFKRTTARVVSTNGLMLVGAGRAVTTFVFTGATNGVTLSDGISLSRVVVEGFSLETTNAAGGKALNADFHTSGGTEHVLRDLAVTFSGAGRWAFGVWANNFETSALYNVRVVQSATVSFHFENFCNAVNCYNCEGTGTSGAGTITRGIEVDGTTDLFWHGGTFQGYYSASLIYVTGSGVHFDKTHLENTNAVPTDGADVVVGNSAAACINGAFTNMVGGSFKIGIPAMGSIRGYWISFSETAAVTFATTALGCGITYTRAASITDNNTAQGNTVLGCSNAVGSPFANKLPGQMLQGNLPAIPVAVAGPLASLTLANNTRLCALDSTGAIKELLFITNADQTFFQFLTVLNLRTTDGTQRAQFSISGTDTILSLSGAGAQFQVNATKVVAARRTGYTNAMTNTVDRATAFDTTTVTLAQLASRVKAIQDDLTTHGLIGP